MSIEEQLQVSLKRQAAAMNVPSKLDEQLRDLYRQPRQVTARPRKLRHRRIAVICIALLLAVPATGFAYEKLTGDEIYGSFETFKLKAETAAMQQYMLFGMKLGGAKKELGDDYEAFKVLLKQAAAAKVKYGDKYGNIDYTKLSPDEYRLQKENAMAIEPYFDRLNHSKPTRDVLTAEEYDRFIEARMTYSSILAQAGIDTKNGPEQLETAVPESLRAPFEQARAIIREVGNKMDH